MLRRQVASLLCIFLLLLSVSLVTRSITDAIQRRYTAWFYYPVTPDEILASGVKGLHGGLTRTIRLTSEGIKTRLDRHDFMHMGPLKLAPIGTYAYDADTFLGIQFNHYLNESRELPYVRELFILAAMGTAALFFGKALGNNVYDDMHIATQYHSPHKQKRFTVPQLTIALAMLALVSFVAAWYIQFDRTTSYRSDYNNPYIHWQFFVTYAVLMFAGAFWYCARFRSVARELNERTLPCRHCGYSSQGSTTPTCPECGVAWSSPRSARARHTIRSVRLLAIVVPGCIAGWGVWTTLSVPSIFGEPQTISLQFSKLHAWLLMSPAAPIATDQTFLYWLLFR